MLMGTSPVIMLAECWCDMVLIGGARNQTREMWLAGELTLSPQGAIFNSIDKLPELYFITAQQTTTTVY